MLVLWLGVGTLGAAVTAARCGDAARAAARALARGETDAAVRSRALAVAPAGAVVRLDRRRDLVSVTVTAVARIGPLPPVRLSETATAVAEEAEVG